MMAILYHYRRIGKGMGEKNLTPRPKLRSARKNPHPLAPSPENAKPAFSGEGESPILITIFGKFLPTVEKPYITRGFVL
jgi:hypothetical protein